MNIEEKIEHTLTDISKTIENYVKNKKITYMEAIVLYSQQNNVEIELIAGIIKKNGSIKSKLQIEAEDLNYLPRHSRLPI